jgi:hypothetical protein
MLTSWIRRKSLKKPTKGRFIVSEAAMSPVMLLGVMGLLVVVGIFVVQHSIAAQHKKPAPTPAAYR